MTLDFVLASSLVFAFRSQYGGIMSDTQEPKPATRNFTRTALRGIAFATPTVMLFLGYQLGRNAAPELPDEKFGAQVIATAESLEIDTKAGIANSKLIGPNIGAPKNLTTYNFNNATTCPYGQPQSAACKPAGTNAFYLEARKAFDTAKAQPDQTSAVILWAHIRQSFPDQKNAGSGQQLSSLMFSGAPQLWTPLRNIKSATPN